MTSLCFCPVGIVQKTIVGLTCRTLPSLCPGYKQFSDRLSFDTVVLYDQILFSFWLSMLELM